MNTQVVAVILQEGGKLLSKFIRSRPPKHPISVTEPLPPMEEVGIRAVAEDAPPAAGVISEEKIKKGTACLPCTNSHLHACVGLLNEATRMSHDGITPDSITRVEQCLGEIVAAERIDLTPANIADLPPEERTIASYASKEIREIRHDLEGLSSSEQLEQIAAKTANLQKYVGQEWFRVRLANMPEKQKKELAEKTISKLFKDS